MPDCHPIFAEEMNLFSAETGTNLLLPQPRDNAPEAGPQNA
jgi:hypothetical protein